MMKSAKKWLYSVALGALLVAGNAAGITVHDVLSNGFWSAEHRGTEAYLQEVARHDPPSKLVKYREKKDENGNRIISATVRSTGPQINNIRWKQRRKMDRLENDKTSYEKNRIKLTSQRDKKYKEKTLTVDQAYRILKHAYVTNATYTSQEDYMVKALKSADIRQMGPFVMEDWFPDSFEAGFLDASFYGTEHNATTNIISDNEAYITRTISQTGHIDSFWDYKVNEDSSLLRTYNTHITTDADHVYVEQQIEENVQNDSGHDSHETYQTQYTAIFKKGRWKSSQEAISMEGNGYTREWLKNFYEEEYKRDYPVSSVDNKVANGVEQGAKVTKVASRSPQRTKDIQNSR